MSEAEYHYHLADISACIALGSFAGLALILAVMAWIVFKEPK